MAWHARPPRAPGHRPRGHNGKPSRCPFQGPYAHVVPIAMARAPSTFRQLGADCTGAETARGLTAAQAAAFMPAAKRSLLSEPGFARNYAGPPPRHPQI